MYQQLSEKVVLDEGTIPKRVSPPVAMAGANAVQVEFAVLSAVVGSAAVTVTVQESNNLENWTDVSNGSDSRTGIGYKSFVAPDVASGERIASAFVRLVWEVEVIGAGEVVVVASGLSTRRA